METLGYVITSTYHYYETTLPKLLPTIPEEEKHKFRIVVCNSPDYKVEVIDGFEYHFTLGNPYDSCGALEVMTWEKKYDYTFHFPCTTSLGGDFFKLTQSFNYYEPDYGMIIPTVNGIMGFAAYKYEFLFIQEIRNAFLAYLNYSKLDTVKNEYTIAGIAKKLNLLGRYPGYTSHEEHGYADVYKTGTKRRITRFGAVDIWKYSANWGEGSGTDTNVGWVKVP